MTLQPLILNLYTFSVHRTVVPTGNWAGVQSPARNTAQSKQETHNRMAATPVAGGNASVVRGNKPTIGEVKFSR